MNGYWITLYLSIDEDFYFQQSYNEFAMVTKSLTSAVVQQGFKMRNYAKQ